MYVHTIHNTPTQEYKEVFEPLLLEEAGAQVLRGIEEGCVIEPHKAVVARCSKVGWDVCFGCVLCVGVFRCARGWRGLQQWCCWDDRSLLHAGSSSMLCCAVLSCASAVYLNVSQHTFCCLSVLTYVVCCAVLCCVLCHVLYAAHNRTPTSTLFASVLTKKCLSR